MKTFDQDVQAVMNLNWGEHAYIFWSEEGGGEVHRTAQGYKLFEVPQYGGEPIFYGDFALGQEVQMVTIAHTWT